MSAPSSAPPGVNVVGYLHAELGLGEAARLLLAGLRAADIPYAPIPYLTIRTRQNAPFAETATPARYSVNVLCINPFELPAVAVELGPEFFRGRYTVGMWWWEIDAVPEPILRGEDFVDEVWVGSEHTAAALRKALRKPVFVFPPPIVPTSPPPLGRSDLGLPGGFVFLFLYDFNSTLERKNPLDLIEAFRRAFEPSDGARLFLKSVNGHVWPDKLAAVHAAADGRSDIVVRDEFLDADRVHALIANSDAYASLHRAEGFGLPLAEAMALGKPVVATRYGGNLEFMTDDNSYLIPWEYAEIPAGAEPYPAGARWAQPDIDAAAKALRHVFDDRDEAAAKAAQAFADVRECHSAGTRGAALGRRLSEIDRIRNEGDAMMSSVLAVRTMSLKKLGYVRDAAEPNQDWRSRMRSGARRIAYRLLFPIFRRQEQYNQETAKVVGDLVQTARTQERTIRDLEAALEELRSDRSSDGTSSTAPDQRIRRSAS